jgi:hypothetical protein
MKKISKSEMLKIVQLVGTWIIIDVAANLIGLWITKLLNEAEYSYPENIFNEFAMPILIQTILFAICLSLGFVFLKKKKFVPYIFIAFQFLVFHSIFIANTAIYKGIHFISNFDDIGIRYLSYSGQYLVDVLYIYFPINGNFENNMFLPSNVGTFYIHWILLNLIYYFAITWLSIKAVKFLFDTKKPITTKVETPETPEIPETPEPVE